MAPLAQRVRVVRLVKPGPRFASGPAEHTQQAANRLEYRGGLLLFAWEITIIRISFVKTEINTQFNVFWLLPYRVHML